MAPRNDRYLSRLIAVVDYNPQWAASFRAERRLILAAVGQVVVDLEHFGSTSVPGLAAKPIVDLLAGVRTLEGVRALAGALLAIGYADCGIQVPGRQLFAKGGPYNEATHHLHFVEYGTPAWRDPLRFRDRLRMDPELARHYAELKRQLARTHGNDINGYSDGKSDFVRSVLG